MLFDTPRVTSIRTKKEEPQLLSANWIGPYWTIAAWVWIALLFWALLFGLFWFQ